MNKIINLIIIVVFAILTSGCAIKQVKTNNINNKIILEVNTTNAKFLAAFKQLKHYGENFMTFKGKVNGMVTDIHFYHGTYKGIVPKGLPATGMIVVCHSAYQPAHLHSRMVRITYHKTRIVLLKDKGSSLVFEVVEHKLKPFQVKLIKQGEAEHTEAQQPMGTITLQ